jgi:hypothetical protein
MVLMVLLVLSSPAHASNDHGVRFSMYCQLWRSFESDAKSPFMNNLLPNQMQNPQLVVPSLQ